MEHWNRWLFLYPDDHFFSNVFPITLVIVIVVAVVIFIVFIFV
jgi:hypothetical protein